MRRRDDGEREVHGGAGAAASAMERESEGERQGRMGMSRGVGARRGGRPGQQGGEGRKQGGEQLRGAHWSRRRAPACLPGQAKQLARAVAGLGRLGGPAGGLPG